MSGFLITLLEEVILRKGVSHVDDAILCGWTADFCALLGMWNFVIWKKFLFLFELHICDPVPVSKIAAVVFFPVCC